MISDEICAFISPADFPWCMARAAPCPVSGDPYGTRGGGRLPGIWRPPRSSFPCRGRLGVSTAREALLLPPPCPRPVSEGDARTETAMADATHHGSWALQEVSNVLVRLHKEQFGRGPTNARSFFAGPDALVCVLEDALLPAERRMVELGEASRVRDSRVAFQAATEPEFIDAVEK